MIVAILAGALYSASYVAPSRIVSFVCILISGTLVMVLRSIP